MKHSLVLRRVWRSSYSRLSTRPSGAARFTPAVDFHATSTHRLPVLAPLLSFLLPALKFSMSFQYVQTASRMVMTLIPTILWKTRKAKAIIYYANLHKIPNFEHEKENHQRTIRYGCRALVFLCVFPFTLYCVTIMASMEQTPITGRWRMIMLSPEEEATIAAQLAGSGWHDAVAAILQQDGSPCIVPPSDWRYKWVNDTLRKLESSIPILSDESHRCPNWMDKSPDASPLPPPSQFPLRPRRSTELLHHACARLYGTEHCYSAPHTIPGPPYSLILVDKPVPNAFSYGFGPDGAGGIVVFTGFIHQILSKLPPHYDAHSPTFAQSLWTQLLAAFKPSRLRYPIPTEAQTSDLAILLAHELSHLVLAHHLETLTSDIVIIPGTFSLLTDVIRVLLFPFTMLFGPFVNDAVARLGELSSHELINSKVTCLTQRQEIEADIVSARFLAHAGFDARRTVEFWEAQAGVVAECAMGGGGEESRYKNKSSLWGQRIVGANHPLADARVKRLKEELGRWEDERQKAVVLRSQEEPV